MSSFANEWDIERYLSLFVSEETPVLSKAARTLRNLAHWTNHNSDGWAYWKKPLNSAQKLIALLEVGMLNYRNASYDENIDVTEEELKKALVPIKAFLTRQGVAHSEVIDIH